MSLIDTLDGILMANAYGWAFINPVRKLWYNLIVTLLGVLVAFVVGFAELFALLAEQLDLEGKFWDFFSMLADNFGIIGYVIIGLFVITWIIAMLVYRYGPFKNLEERVVVIQHTSTPSAPREEPDLEYGTSEK
jgi:high-affinity nickel-transport protein